MLTIKVTLKSSESISITRKITLESAPTWAQLAALLSTRFNVRPQEIALSYTDEDGDQITLSTDDELTELLSSSTISKSPLRLNLTRLGDFEIVPSLAASAAATGVAGGFNASRETRAVEREGAFSDVGSNAGSASEGSEYQLLDYPDAEAGQEKDAEDEGVGKGATSEKHSKASGIGQVGGEMPSDLLEEMVQKYQRHDDLLDILHTLNPPPTDPPAFPEDFEDPSDVSLPEAPAAGPNSSDPDDEPLQRTRRLSIHSLLDTLNAHFQGVREHLTETLSQGAHNPNTAPSTPSETAHAEDPSDEPLPEPIFPTTTDVPSLTALFESLNVHLEGIRSTVAESLSGLASHLVAIATTPVDELPAAMHAAGLEVKTAFQEVMGDIRKEAEEVREEFRKFKSEVEEARKNSMEEESNAPDLPSNVPATEEEKVKEEGTGFQDGGAETNETLWGSRHSLLREARRARRDLRTVRRESRYSGKPETVLAPTELGQSDPTAIPTTPPINWAPLVPGRFPSEPIAPSPVQASTDATSLGLAGLGRPSTSSNNAAPVRVPSDRRKPIGPREMRMRWSSVAPASVPARPSSDSGISIPGAFEQPIASTSAEPYTVETPLERFRHAVFELGFDSRDLKTQVVIERVWARHQGEGVEVLVANAVQELCV